MQWICNPLQNECQGLKPEIIRLITVVFKYSAKQRICYPLQNKYQGLQPKKSISFLKCAINDKTAYE